MGHDVFISYPSKTKPIADAICAKLESQNIRCWFAPRDILPGQPYAKALVDAIDSSKIFILVFSAETNNSPHIMSEVREAFNNTLVIIPFRIDNILPSKELEFYIGAPHWLDAMTPPLERHIDELVRVVRLNLGTETPPIAKFSTNITSGKVPLTVNFSEESSGNPSHFLWDFGDGTTSAEKNPVHTYTRTGDFTVTLSVTNENGLHHNSQTDLIHTIPDGQEPIPGSQKIVREKKNPVTPEDGERNRKIIMTVVGLLIILGVLLILFYHNAGEIKPNTQSVNGTHADQVIIPTTKTTTPPVTSAGLMTWNFDSGYDGWTPGGTYHSNFPAVEQCWKNHDGTCAGNGGVAIIDACSGDYQELWKIITLPDSPTKIKIHVVKATEGEFHDGRLQTIAGETVLGTVNIQSGYNNDIEYSVPASFQGTSTIIRLRSVGNDCNGEYIGINSVTVF